MLTLGYLSKSMLVCGPERLNLSLRVWRDIPENLLGLIGSDDFKKLKFLGHFPMHFLHFVFSLIFTARALSFFFIFHDLIFYLFHQVVCKTVHLTIVLAEVEVSVRLLQ